MRETKKPVRGAGRVAFLARQEGIKKMTEEGHPLLSIYQKYEGDLNISYSQFVRYVGRYIKGEVKNEPKPKQAKASPIRTRTPDQPAFVSSATPRDDLIHPKPKG